MNKTKKVLIALLSAACAACCAFGIAACSDDSSTTDDEIYAVYQAYAESGGTLSYSEWLASIKGEKGDKGDKGDTGDTGAIGATGATGAAGTNGTNGTDGADGADGATWLTGKGAPTATANDGDLYLDTATAYVYKYGEYGYDGYGWYFLCYIGGKEAVLTTGDNSVYFDGDEETVFTFTPEVSGYYIFTAAGSDYGVDIVLDSAGYADYSDDSYVTLDSMENKNIEIVGLEAGVAYEVYCRTATWCSGVYTLTIEAPTVIEVEQFVSENEYPSADEETYSFTAKYSGEYLIEIIEGDDYTVTVYANSSDELATLNSKDNIGSTATVTLEAGSTYDICYTPSSNGSYTIMISYIGVGTGYTPAEASLNTEYSYDSSAGNYASLADGNIYGNVYTYTTDSDATSLYITVEYGYVYVVTDLDNLNAGSNSSANASDDGSGETSKVEVDADTTYYIILCQGTFEESGTAAFTLSLTTSEE